MIRDATSEDIPRLVAMGERFLTETVYRDRGVGVNAAAMTRTVLLLLNSPTGAVFVAEDAGALVAMIGLLLFENPITGELTASELFWWVEPEHRGRGGYGVRLLKRGEQWARTTGAHKIHMIAPTQAVGELYRRLGYDYLETAYQKAI